MQDAIIVLIIFGTFFAMLYVFLTTRNKERLALIEKGADAKLFKSGTSNSNWSGVLIVNLAMLAVGIGIGIMIGGVFRSIGVDGEIAIPAAIFSCGGAGLLGGFFMSRKLVVSKKED